MQEMSIVEALSTLQMLVADRPDDAAVDVECDVLRGITQAIIHTVQTVATLSQERSDLMASVGALAAENISLKQQLQYAPVVRRLKVGDHVRVNSIAGFHRGARGVVQFVEPSYDNIWVLRDGASSPVSYHPSELDIIEDLDGVGTTA